MKLNKHSFENIMKDIGFVFLVYCVFFTLLNMVGVKDSAWSVLGQLTVYGVLLTIFYSFFNFLAWGFKSLRNKLVK
jgi:hypothetical protein